MNLGKAWQQVSHLRTAGRDVSDWKPFENIIEFFSRCRGINLTPQQRFIYKCLYGLPLDDSQEDIVIFDKFAENEVGRFSEVSFFEYLKNDKRINQESPEAMVGRNFIIVVLVIGRRGSKSFLTAGVQAYETSRLLSKYNPHEYYDIIPGEKIWLKSVAPTGGQSQVIFDFARSIMVNNGFFDQFWNKDIQGYVALNSRYELDQQDKLGRKGFANPKGSVCMTFESCISRHLRGPGHYMVTLDEVAHYILATNSVSSDENVFQALEPSTATFKDRSTGQKDGRVYLISSPLNQAGLFFQQYIDSFADPENVLMIQLPSWEANPTRLDSKTLKRVHKSSPEIFDVEYGAIFSASLNVYVEMPWLERCFDKEKKRTEVGIPGVWYYLGTDLGHKNDATAFVVVHLDWDGNIVFDYAEVWDPEETGIPNDAEHVQAHILDLTKKFYIKNGTLDQFNGWAMRDWLKSKGFRRIELVNISEQYKMKCFMSAKDYIRSGKVKGYWDDRLCNDLLRLREIKKSEYRIHVTKFGPFKDDLPDAFVRASWLAIEAAHESQRGRETSGFVSRRRSRGRRRREVPSGRNRWGVQR